MTYRYIKNRETVQRICKVLGYRLVGFDPRWTVASISEKMSSNMLETISNQLIGKYDDIPDEFMGKVALLMGFEWQFPESDEQLEGFIRDCELRIRETSERMKVLKDKIDEVNNEDCIERIYNTKEDIDEYIREMEDECNEKIRLFQGKLNIRDKIREWRRE